MADASKEGAVIPGQDYHAVLGAICSVMMRSPIYCSYPIACVTEWIRPAVLLRQFHIFKDAGGSIVGYMTWAFLAEDAARRLTDDPAVLLHLSEWNEGDRLWIMDFVVLNQDVRRFARLAKQVLRDCSEAWSLRRYEDGSIRKVVHWRELR